MGAACTTFRRSQQCMALLTQRSHKIDANRDMGNLNKSWPEPTLQFVEIPAGAKPLSFPFCSQIQEKMPTLYGDMRGLFLF